MANPHKPRFLAKFTPARRIAIRCRRPVWFRTTPPPTILRTHEAMRLIPVTIHNLALFPVLPLLAINVPLE
jgi:hypothetical protein